MRQKQAANYNLRMKAIDENLLISVTRFKGMQSLQLDNRLCIWVGQVAYLEFTSQLRAFLCDGDDDHKNK